MQSILTFKKNRLLLAGLLAFAILIFTQITVLAYDYGGGWSVVKNVGGAGVQWLNVGNPLIEADVNAGQTPAVTTNAVTDTGTLGGITQATLNANITDMGAVADTFTSFQYSTDLSFNQSTPEVVQSSTGTFSSIVLGVMRNVSYNVRSVTRNDNVIIYGNTQTFVVGGSAPFNLIDVTIIAIIALLVILVLQFALPSETSIIIRLVLIGVVIYMVLAFLPGLQTMLNSF